MTRARSHQQLSLAKFNAKLSVNLTDYGLTQVKAYREHHGVYPQVAIGNTVYGSSDNRCYAAEGAWHSLCRQGTKRGSTRRSFQRASKNHEKSYSKALCWLRESTRIKGVWKGLILFARLNEPITAAGYIPRQGQIVDASIVAAPRQRNGRQDNAKIKRGETPESWRNNPKRLRQKDQDARWTKNHGKTHYGYKNHIGVDRKHKLIRRFEVTAASVADNQVFDALIDPDNTNAAIWADAAYRSKACERALKGAGYRSHIHTKGQANRPISACQQQTNRKRSKKRCRGEHVFAAQQAMGGKLVRTIGLARARVKIAMMNIVYNLSRWAWLQTAASPSRL